MVVRFSGDNIKHAKKLGKLFKSKKLKSKKMSKSQNLAKLEKKSSKNRKSSNFDTKKKQTKLFNLGC